MDALDRSRLVAQHGKERRISWFAFCEPMATVTAVNRLKQAVALTLLVLWVPVTMHCTLETVPGLSFLQSCCGGYETPQPANDCEEDFCGAVESGIYRIEDNPTLAPGLALLLAFAGWEWVAEPPAESASHLAPVSLAPPELPRFWQFHYRTALPPRAPSLVA